MNKNDISIKLYGFNHIDKATAYKKDVSIYGNHKEENVEVVVLKMKTESQAKELCERINTKLQEFNKLLAKHQ